MDMDEAIEDYWQKLLRELCDAVAKFRNNWNWSRNYESDSDRFWVRHQWDPTNSGNLGEEIIVTIDCQRSSAAGSDPDLIETLTDIVLTQTVQPRVGDPAQKTHSI